MKAAVIALTVAVLLVGGILIGVLINGQNIDKEAAYKACMTDKGVYETSNTSDMADMAESCYASIYGD